MKFENKTSYGLYGDNDQLIRIFDKKEVTLEDVYRHVDKMKKENKS